MAAGQGLAGEGVAEAVGLKRKGGTLWRPVMRKARSLVYLDGLAGEGRAFAHETVEVDAGLGTQHAPAHRVEGGRADR